MATSITYCFEITIGNDYKLVEVTTASREDAEVRLREQYPSLSEIKLLDIRKELL